jgi:hypothetical protein
LITLDLDGRPEFGEDECYLEATIKLASSLSLIRAIYGDDREVKVSKTRKGYHIISDGFDYSLENEQMIRKLLGDDETRIYLDAHRRKEGSLVCNVLWDYKLGYSSKPISQEMIDVLQEYSSGKSGD